MTVTLSEDLRVDGGEIGLTADPDLMALASGILTLNGNLRVEGGDIGISTDADLLGLADAVVTVRGDARPGTDATFDLGSSSLAWRDAHLSRNLLFGGDVQLSRGAANRLDLATGDTLHIVSDGSASVPAISIGATDDGFYQNTDNQISLALSGQAVIVVGEEFSAFAEQLRLNATTTNNAVLEANGATGGMGTARLNLSIAGLFRYTLVYDASVARFALLSTDIDGLGTNGDVIRIADGQRGVVFLGGVEIDGELDHDGSTAGFYGVAPVAQATTSVSEAAFTENSGTAVNENSTFGGYTLQQVIQALQNIGILA